MEKDYEKKYHGIEKTHFWFKARRDFILQLLQKQDRESSILDIGCSSGILMMDLIDDGFKKENIFGFDISEEAIKNCKKNGLDNVAVLDAQNFDLDNKYDIIIASDCLEHLKEDEKALSIWKQHLKPGGKMYVFVPAFMFMWSHHDDVNMHARRYTKKNLIDKLKQQDFIILDHGFWNFLLFFPVILVRILSKILPHRNQSSSGDLDKLSIFNRIFLSILSFENRLAHHIKLPIGLSTFAIVSLDKSERNSY